jgi:TrmH family RNA methyltransferase
LNALFSRSQLKSLTSLQQKKYRQKSGRFLVEGVRLCEALSDSDHTVLQVFYCPEALNARGENILTALHRRGIESITLTRQDADRISNTKTSQGIFALVQTRNLTLEALLAGRPGRLLVTDNVSEPGNLGTIIRSAAWFGVDGMILGTDTVEYSNPKVVRSSAGAVFALPVAADVDLPTKLPELIAAGYSLFISDVQSGRSYLDVLWPDRTVLILGNEANGVSAGVRALPAEQVYIPRFGRGESLNVAAAAAIILADLCNKKSSKNPARRNTNAPA